MALAITAPVPVTHSGESDPALYPEVIAGQAFPDVVGTSATSAGNLTVHISSPEANVDVTVTITATLTAFTTAGILSYIAEEPGLYTVTVKDVTAGTSVTKTIEVLSSEGV